MNTVDHEVIIVGAGPTGRLLASELSRVGVDVGLLERHPHPTSGTRAIGVHGPVLAALEASGATERILQDAVRVPRGVAKVGKRVIGEISFAQLNSRFPFVASTPQSVTETAVSADAPDPVLGTEVQAITDFGDHVAVAYQHADLVVERRANVVVVAAGGSGRDALLPHVRVGAKPVDSSRRALRTASDDIVIRQRAEPFQTIPAKPFGDHYLMTDLEHAPEEPPDTAVITLDAAGVLESFPLPGGGRRLVAWSGRHTLDAKTSPTLRLRRIVARRSTGPNPIDGPLLAARIESASTFTIHRILLSRLRRGRVFVIGDAAHEVSPIGGQGMNLGLLDAVSLAPLLVRSLAADDRTRGRRRGLRSAGFDAILPETLHLDLNHWEQRRLASARTAARLADLNTAVGRGRSAAAHRVLTSVLSTAMSTPLHRVAAHAYAMGFDRTE